MRSVPYRILAYFGPNYIRPKNENSDEIRYLCPRCLERKGTPDRSGHLFVNVVSCKFYCVRCGYAGVVSKDLKVEESKIYDEDREKDIEKTIHEFASVLDKETDTFKLKIPIDKVTTSQTATQYLLDRGFTYDQMEYYDLRVGNRTQEFGRIVIPNRVKKVVYTDTYSARTYIGQTPKYHNPFDVKKSEIVFNLHRIKEKTPIILVEGALTAIAAGYHAVASLGKVLSRSQASQIVAKHPSVVFVNYDHGAEKELIDACRLLHQIDPSIRLQMVFMEDERDAADLTHDDYARCLERSKEYVPLISDVEKILRK